MRKVIRRVIPDWARSVRSWWHNRPLVSELETLRIEALGADEDVPWIELEDGLRFHGLPPTDKDRALYRAIQARIPDIPEACFAVAREIISRYRVPRSLPGETVFAPSRYDPLRDPLNDFDLDVAQRRALAERFRPRDGQTFADVGSYLGFGTMRIAELVGSSGRVIAFESDPEIGKILRKNVEHNLFDNITLVQAAVSNTRGATSFFRTSGMANSLRDGVLRERGYTDLAQVEVQGDTLDLRLGEVGVGEVDFASLTINGGEVEALEGMEETLTRSPSLRLTLAGWYYRPDLARRVCDVVGPRLQDMGFTVLIGRLGRVLAWKDDPIESGK